jgi:ribonuclease HII
MAVIVPTLRYERSLWRDGASRVAGVDEVGVAPTCGAVVAAAVVMAPNCHRIPGVRDSKTLSPAQRERLAPLIRRRAVAIGVGAASVADIDRLNIYHATHLAMRRAIGRLGGHDHVLVDGLRIAEFEQQVGPYTAIVDGDAKVYSIACASVVAKTVRDRMMAGLAARYPQYGWERNQGYATREHRNAIRAHGLTPHHRRSFQALQVLLAGDQLGLFDGVPVMDDGSLPTDAADDLALDSLAATT